MDKKLMVKITIEKNDHEFSFTMPVGCPIGTAYDAAFAILNEVVAIAKEAVAKQEKLDIVTDCTQ